MGRSRARRQSEAAPTGGGTAAERRAWTLLQWSERPAVHAALLAALLLASLAVRLPHAYDEAGYFRHHADEASYFNKANELMLHDAAPLAHGGSGLPVFLKAVFTASGQAPVAPVQQGQSSPLGPDQLAAARLAYLVNTLLGVLTVAAAYVLARPLLRPAKALLATALVAFDPFLLNLSGHLMAEPLFVLLATLAAAAAVRAVRRPSWLLAMAAFMALAGTVRGNGIVVFAALAAFAAFALRRSGARPWGRWLAGAVLVYFLVQAPYLAWRAQYLPGPFDYGTNGRFFADRLWDFSDPYWQDYTMRGGGPKEGLGDYLAAHSAGEALRRLYLSLQMQVVDLFGGDPTGHRLHPEGAVLHPLLAAPLLVGLLAERRRRELHAFTWVAALTILALTWMYWIHDSPRYLGMLVPLAAPVAVEGLAWLGRRLAMPGALALGYAAAFLAVDALIPLWDGLAALGRDNPSWGWTLALLLAALALALAAPLAEAWRSRKGGVGVAP